MMFSSRSVERTARPAKAAAAARPPVDCNLYYSSAVEGDIRTLLGVPHYSYRFAEGKFVAALMEKGVVPHQLRMPEFYSRPESLPEAVHRPGLTDIHLIFRSTEQFRLLKFAWNVCCFAWEFDVLKDWTAVGEHPFLNQRRMLGLCDEVWVPCRYTQATLHSYAMNNVHVIPAPIAVQQRQRSAPLDCLSYLGRCAAVPLRCSFLRPRERRREEMAEKIGTLATLVGARIGRAPDLRIYLAILNPEDFRKNLDAMLRGFHYFSKGRENVLLLVKTLTSSKRYGLLDVVADAIPHVLGGVALESDNILFFNEFLDDDEMTHLYHMSDFYLCTSLCEGQNLPLLEAMAHGVVPVSTANTAMADYIDADNAVVIEDHSVVNDIPHLAGTAAGKPFSIRRCTAADIRSALESSAGLSPGRYAEMSASARRRVQERYSIDVIWPRIEARLQALTSRLKQR